MTAFADPASRGVYSVAAVRAIDRAAIETAGISGYELMTRAAQYAFDVALAKYPAASYWQILCGGGNNAGDGYVLARLAAAAGIDVEALWLSAPERLDGDAATAHRELVAAGGRARAWPGALDAGAELLIDAMLGSGLSRDVGGSYREAVVAANAHPAPILALDVPTGLHGDSGQIQGSSIFADTTVTFVADKPGLYLGAGPDAAGRVYLSTLSIPASCGDGVEATLRIVSDDALRHALPPRARQSHKGDFGHVVLIGGAPGMPGAVRLAGEAALRSGAGRVSVACAAVNATVIPAGRPELMCHGVADADDLDRLLATATLIAIGPGLGQSDWSAGLLQAATASGLPMVLDADALHLLAATPGVSEQRILTPHPGEAARLLGTSAAAIQADRVTAVAALQHRYGGTVVLKGCGSLVADGNGPPWLCPRGNPGMATAGMGDVLTGVIAGLWAQGLARSSAAVLGVELHARAADDAALSGGERGLLASDVLQELRPWLNP